MLPNSEYLVTSTADFVKKIIDYDMTSNSILASMDGGSKRGIGICGKLHRKLCLMELGYSKYPQIRF